MENKLNTVNIFLADVVDNTGSNAEGLKLFNILLDNINNRTIINTDKNMGFSSSFLNSSIGLYIETYGFEYFKKHIGFLCTKSQSDLIRDYIYKIQTYA